MKRLLTLTTVALFALAIASSSAAAKRMTSMTLCGAAGCTTIDDPQRLHGLEPSGAPAGPPERTSGWYRARLTFEAGRNDEVVQLTVMPAAGYMRFEGVWTYLSSSTAAAWRRVAGAVEPFPESTLAARTEVRTDAPGGGAGERPGDRPATTTSGAPEGSSPWGWVAVAIAVAAAIGLGLALLRRRRARPEP